jgi:hypothetical protein
MEVPEVFEGELAPWAAMTCLKPRIGHDPVGLCPTGPHCIHIVFHFYGPRQRPTLEWIIPSV